MNTENKHNEMIEGVEEETSTKLTGKAIKNKEMIVSIDEGFLRRSLESVDGLAVKIDKELPSGNPYEWECPDGYQFTDENGNVINATKIVLEKKKKEYPKTYEECEKVLRYDSHRLDNMGVTVRGYKWELIRAFQILLICRDAYWKIAGEEMGLGKPWSPNWHDDEKKYTIEYYDGEIIKDFSLLENRISSFPTPEMRDAFCENFKDLIEQCKELL